MKWIAIQDRLPKEGKYVLARHNRDTWHDSDDQENVNCMVVKLVKGISLKDREYLKLSKKEKDIKRSKTWRSADEGNNNQRAYYWYSFGCDSFFGQEISHWCPIPPIDNKE